MGRIAEAAPSRKVIPFRDAIFVHSCEMMPELPDCSVNLTVTSPPYWNAIDYDSHTGNPEGDYRPRQNMDYQDYLHFLESCFAETLRVHKEGSVCAVIIGTVLLNGTHVPLPFHFVNLMEKMGWVFHQDIIWAKCTGGVKRAGSTIQHPYPGYYYPNIMTEYVLLFRKPGGRRIYAGKSDKEKQHNRVEIDSVFTKEVANNIWHIAPVPPNQLPHPCPFPEEIPYRLIRWFSYQGDLVLDPFGGIGTTPKVAAALHRHWVAYEIKPEYAEITKSRVTEPLVLREQLIAKYDKIEYGVREPGTRSSRAPFRRERSLLKSSSNSNGDLFTNLEKE